MHSFLDLGLTIRFCGPFVRANGILFMLVYVYVQSIPYSYSPRNSCSCRNSNNIQTLVQAAGLGYQQKRPASTCSLLKYYFLLLVKAFLLTIVITDFHTSLSISLLHSLLFTHLGDTQEADFLRALIFWLRVAHCAPPY